MIASLLLAIMSLSVSSPRWQALPDRTGIRWDVKADVRLPHADRLEMSGHHVSVLFGYSVTADRNLGHSMTVIGPTFRMPIAATSNQFCHVFSEQEIPHLEVDGKVLREKVREIRFDGVWTAVSETEQGLTVVRRVFPSTEDAAGYETIEVRNDGKAACDVIACGGFAAEVEGLKGRYAYGARIRPQGAVRIAVGETATFGIRCGMRFATPDEPTFDAERELASRRRRVAELASQVVLETDVPEIDVAFRLSKIRVGESVYRTDGGLMHSPGCGKFYGAMWPNDQIEYVGPWFAMTGDEDGQESVLNACRWFMGKMTPEYRPLPGAINREGEGVWDAKERGDAAMFASGAAGFALNAGRREWAERLFPGLEWSLEFCRRKLTADGVVASDFDELEGRFPCGKANLCTSSICLEALRRSALVARALGRDRQAQDWTVRADALERAIERHFGAEMNGWTTYRYFDGCDKLRAWMAAPVAAGIRSRARGTFDALFSDRIWTGTELLTEEGDPTVWDRSLLTAFRGFAAAGFGTETWERVQAYVRHRFFGEHVPYPIEQNMFRNGAHSAAEGALFCRIFTEGFFGLEATGLGCFAANGRLPRGVSRMALRNIRAFGQVFDVVLERDDVRILVREAGPSPSMPDPAEISRRISEQFLSTRPDAYEPIGMKGHTYVYGGGSSLHYSVCSLWANALVCARLAGQEDLERRLLELYRRYATERKDVFHRRKHVDWEITGAVPLQVAVLTGDEAAGRLGLFYADRQWEEPHPDDDTVKGNVTFEDRLSWWRQGYSPETRLWIDDMYMIAVLQMLAYRYTGDVKYRDRVAREMSLYLDRLPKCDGLYFHAPNAPFIWARGNGWMAGAMPMVLKELPDDHPNRGKILGEYKAMMASLLRYQRASGLWGQLVDDKESWDETSGSAMYAYAFAEGVRHGWLGPEYAAARNKAYAALVARLDEYANLADVCIGTGARNDRAWYMNRNKVIGDPHGQAPLLWLCRVLLEGNSTGIGSNELRASPFGRATDDPSDGACRQRVALVENSANEGTGKR